MLNPSFFIPTGELAPHFRLIWQESKPHPSIITPVADTESFIFDECESSDTDIFYSQGTNNEAIPTRTSFL